MKKNPYLTKIQYRALRKQKILTLSIHQANSQAMRRRHERLHMGFIMTPLHEPAF